MALKGNQKKIDANKNGKMHKDDFAMLRGKKGTVSVQGQKAGNAS
jgi:hypothetical protein